MVEVLVTVLVLVVVMVAVVVLGGTPTMKIRLAEISTPAMIIAEAIAM
jgi:hypothetical protein